MLEIWRYTYNHRTKAFLLVVFKTTEGYLLKIFLDKKVIQQFSGFISDEESIQWQEYAPENPFEILVNTAIEWIRENDRDNSNPFS